MTREKLAYAYCLLDNNFSFAVEVFQRCLIKVFSLNIVCNNLLVFISVIRECFLQLLTHAVDYFSSQTFSRLKTCIILVFLRTWYVIPLFASLACAMSIWGF